jgi:hypothetical protein
MLSVSKFTQQAMNDIFIEQCKLDHLRIVKLFTSPKYVDEHAIKIMITANNYEALEMACIYNCADIFLLLEYLLVKYGCSTKLIIKKYEKKRFKCHNDMQLLLKQMIVNSKIIKN